MVNKIQELTDKLFQEGLQKGKTESEKMIDEASAQSKTMIYEAQKKAADIVADAQKEAQDLKDNTLKELSLASKQAVADLKQTITDLLTKGSVSAATSSAFSNDNFIQELILSIVQQWSKENNIAASVQVPDDKKQVISEYILASTKANLNKGITIDGTSGVKGGFRIAQKDGRYYINFTDKEFDAFFKAYLRPRVASILYGEE
ncbi:MAG: hypothetical protein RR363_06060 [Rikenellaceae bacterium]